MTTTKKEKSIPSFHKAFYLWILLLSTASLQLTTMLWGNVFSITIPLTSSIRGAMKSPEAGVREKMNAASLTTDQQEQDSPIISFAGESNMINKSTITTSQHRRQVHWFDSSKISGCDYFSGAWLMPKGSFLETPTSTMIGLEDSVHKVYKKHKSNVRMAQDWMDFSVEHMSKWWKILGATTREDDSVGINRIIGAFKNYTSQNNKPMASSDLLQSTIAIIPYQTSLDERGVKALKWSSELSIVALQATITSIARLGVGRIVVVTMKDYREEMHVQRALDMFKNGTSTEYSHVQVTNEKWYKTQNNEENLPCASVVGLQHAFQGKLSSEETRQWLGGNAQNWKYVYYTEPDTVLQTRQSALPAIREALEQGMVLMPHRWQPMPHHTDVNGARGGHIKADGGQLAEMIVMEFDRENGSCCDMNNHPSEKFKHCGNFWYMCGFGGIKNVNRTNQDLAHERLLPYGFIKIKGGTGIVSLRATEHGRICRPEKGRPGFVCNSNS